MALNKNRVRKPDMHSAPCCTLLLSEMTLIAHCSRHEEKRGRTAVKSHCSKRDIAFSRSRQCSLISSLQRKELEREKYLLCTSKSTRKKKKCCRAIVRKHFYPQRSFVCCTFFRFEIFLGFVRKSRSPPLGTRSAASMDYRAVDKRCIRKIEAFSQGQQYIARIGGDAKLAIEGEKRWPFLASTECSSAN